MIRPLTIVTFLMACGSGLYLYQSKHEAQVLDRTIEKTVRDIAAYREQSRLLAAEWTMLNDPETLRRFSDSYLRLKTITPSQFTSLADLDARLPPVPLPASSDISEEEVSAEVAVATASTFVATEAVPPLPVPAVPGPVVLEPAVPGPAVPAVVVDDHSRVMPRTVVSEPGTSAVTAAERSADRKVTVAAKSVVAAPVYRSIRADAPSKSASTDAAPRPVATDAVPFTRVVSTAIPRPLDAKPLEARRFEPKLAESRLAEPHLGDPRPADQHTAQFAETRVAEPRDAAVRTPGPLPQLPSTIVAVSTRHVAANPVATPIPTARNNTSAQPAPVPILAASQSTYGGSLLGMARGSAPPPAPRPTPINAAQGYNAN